MASENFSLTIITDYIKQLEHCHTVFDVSRTAIRNFVGYFMPEKAVFFLAPNSSYPYFKCIDRYALSEDFPQEIPGNGGLISVTRSLLGANIITEKHLINLIEPEYNIMSQFQYFIPITNQLHYAGILLFSMRKNKILELNDDDKEYLHILSALSAKTFQSLIKPVDIHLDKVTKLYTKDFLIAMMTHYKHLARELVQNSSISFDLSKKVLPRRVSVLGPLGENSLQIGYTIILIKVQNLNELNAKFDFEKGNQVLQQFGLELKLMLRKSDIPTRYEGSQFIILLPLTTKNEAILLKSELQNILTIVKKKQLIPENFPLTLKFGFAHFPLDGEETYTLIKSAEDNLND